MYELQYVPLALPFLSLLSRPVRLPRDPDPGPRAAIRVREAGPQPQLECGALLLLLASLIGSSR